jgi:nitrite reductase/ring-hydroxylating ferredoxin subunit
MGRNCRPISQFLRVATSREILPGQFKATPLLGRDIVLFNDRGTVHVFKNSVPIWGFRRTGEPRRRPSSPAEVTFGSSTSGLEILWIIRRRAVRFYRVEIRGDTAWVEVP